ncbi:hypothetical protein INR49_031556 [Caranx melampygus]|nr:hypothetical protein INR49_031556 [Caranx melampygus]
MESIDDPLTDSQTPSTTNTTTTTTTINNTTTPPKPWSRKRQEATQVRQGPLGGSKHMWLQAPPLECTYEMHCYQSASISTSISYTAMVS